MRRKILIAISALLISLPQASGQTDDSAYQEYVKTYMSGLRQFKNARDSAFVAMMRGRWEDFNATRGESLVREPKPDKVPSVTESPVLPAPPGTAPVITPPAPSVTPDYPRGIGSGNFSFSFLGTQIRVPLYSDMRFRLGSLSDKSVADAFEGLCTKDYREIVDAFSDVREKLCLNDYFHMLLIKAAAEKFYGRDSDEAILFTMFISAQSGMKVRVAKIQDSLALLYSASPAVYEVPFLELGGEKYYIHNFKSGSPMSLRTYRDMPAAGLRDVELRLKAIPKLSSDTPEEITKVYGDMSITTRPDRTLMQFYSLIPTTDYEVYRTAPVSRQMETDVIPALRIAIDGKNEREAVGRILAFVQHAFAYKTDHRQFGRERPLFPDENFHYPYNDCEDRSFLFELLVRRLTGLDVVVLSYPGHAATAVCFNGDVPGDAVNLQGKRYVICDPTYIGAGISIAMPDFRGIAPEINR